MEGIECFGYLFTNRPLKERFERASQQLKYTCRRKTRLARVGVEHTRSLNYAWISTPPPATTVYSLKPCGTTS